MTDGAAEAAESLSAPLEPAAVAADDPERDAAIAELERDRDRLIGEVATYQARAEASRVARTHLEMERREALAAGRDAALLRQRRRDAEDDANDSATAAELARERLSAVESRIAELTGGRDLARLRLELAAAAAQRHEVYARTGERQRAAVTAAAEAARELIASYADEIAADNRVAEMHAAVAGLCGRLGVQPDQVPAEPPRTALTIAPADAPGGRSLALLRALVQARRYAEAGADDITEVSRALGEVCGWQPPTADELEAQAAEARRMLAVRDKQMQRQQLQPGIRPEVTDLDEHRRPIWPQDRTNAYPGVPPERAFSPWHGPAGMGYGA